ncbi:MAG: T9SS type A sorting domain-containing protein [Bacteroidales bacterium]|nr:T9SS type A sorting domain-containing protein [Bacteroidales bacterium]
MKSNGLLYFNINENTNTSIGGIYTFDGASLNLLINRNFINDYEIVNDKIWVTDYSGSDISIYDTDGNVESYNNAGFTLNLEKASLCADNDSLFIVGFETACLFSDQLLKTVYRSITYSYTECKKVNKYQDGFLAKTTDFKLSYINLNNNNNFGTPQPFKNYKNLDINRVDAFYHNRGQMFWDLDGNARYEAPKGLGKNSLFLTGLWITGKDENDTDYLSAVRYNADGFDYAPGPLKSEGIDKGTTDTLASYQYDYIWKVTKQEILYHQLYYSDPSYTIPQDILTWPAHGNVTADYDLNLAPFVDVNADGIYEPLQGDYPNIKGDMSLYWIFNDNLIPNTESGGIPLQAEIHAQAYAYYCDTLTDDDTGINYTAESTILNYTTFLDFKIINRSARDYHDFTLGLVVDGDVGDGSDDYVGTNVELNSLYFTNGDEYDGNGSGNTYGTNPPVQFITLLNAPLAENGDGIDNDNDGTIDEPEEQSLLNGMVYFNSGTGATGDPENFDDYLNYLKGLWKDNRPLTYGGNGYLPGGGVQCKYMYPGDSDPWYNGTFGVDPNYTGEWTEENEDIESGDRRALMSSGPFNFESNEVLEFTFALIWTRGYGNVFSDTEKGFNEIQSIIDMYHADALSGCIPDVVQTISENKEQTLEIAPNPTSDIVLVKGIEGGSSYQIINSTGNIIKVGKLNNDNSISLSDLKSGIYFIKIINKKGVYSQKKIKI